MAEEKKFRPVITRVKLNPEQAVLACCALIARKGRRTGSRQCTSTTCGSNRNQNLSS